MSKQATKTRSSWSEKLDQSKGLPKVVPIGPTMSKQWGEGTVVVPAPREVDAIMKSVPAGKLITIQEIRAILAERHGATIGCPLTVGHLRLDRRARGRGRPQGQAARCHALLADAQIRRLLEREVSRRQSRPTKRSSRPRVTRSIQQASGSPWRISRSLWRLPHEAIDERRG